MTESRIASLAASSLLADVPDADRHHVAASILNRAGLDTQGQPARNLAEVAAELLTAESWWVNHQASKPAVHHEPALSHGERIERASAAARAKLENDRNIMLDAYAFGPNPWSRSSINLTRQGLLARYRPADAARLQREAERG